MHYILQRLLAAVATLVIVSIAVFAMIRLIPGDPAFLILGDRATPEMLESMRERLGLNQPLPLQYLNWLLSALTGDLGLSIRTDAPILPLVLSRLWVSTQIVVPAVVVSALVAVPLGTLAAWRQNRAIDIGTVAVATLLLSIPTFWLGLLLLLAFGLKLGWFPVVGYVSISDDWLAGLIYLVMPVSTLVIHEIGSLIRMVRSSTIEVLSLDYITHARAKGLSEAQVLWRHAVKNAFGPTWTLLGLILGNLLGGIAVVETVFTIPGLGRLLIESIFARDYPVIQGCMLVVAVAYLLINLAVDLLYPLFDPRVAVQ